jgi:biotin carboxyl carrier protein
LNKFQFSVGGDKVETSVERDGSGWCVEIDDRRYEIAPLPNDLFGVTVDGRRTVAAAVKHKGTVYVDLGRVQLELTESSDAATGGVAGDQRRGKDKVYAPMPGRVVKIMVSVGDLVTERQQLAIVEAMKMENSVLAPAAGKVKAVNFAAGDQVDTESPIVELEIAP